MPLFERRKKKFLMFVAWRRLCAFTIAVWILSGITDNWLVDCLAALSVEKNLATNREVMQCSAVDRQSERSINQPHP